MNLLSVNSLTAFKYLALILVFNACLVFTRVELEGSQTILR